MEFEKYIPIWSKLTPEQQNIIKNSAVMHRVPAQSVIHNGSVDCMGLVIVCSGQLRSFILSDEGREVTVYRLFERDICLFSSSCIMPSIQFEITVSAEKQSELMVIPPNSFKRVLSTSAPFANYINEIMASRLSEAIWLLERILWKSLDKRLAVFLLEEASLESTSILHITHERIANHMGTAREVITRVLKYFQNEGLVSIGRGTIELLNIPQLEKLV